MTDAPETTPSTTTPDAVQAALTEAGTKLRAALWRDSDAAFLRARATDLVELNAKAVATSVPSERAAYVAAARDVVRQVQLIATVRIEATASAATSHDALIEAATFFVQTLLPLLVKLLPALAALKA